MQSKKVNLIGSYKLNHFSNYHPYGQWVFDKSL